MGVIDRVVSGAKGRSSWANALVDQVNLNTLTVAGRNKIDNGAKLVCQRPLSVAGVNSVSGIRVSDRWNMLLSGGPAWTISNEADGPAGTGLVRSQKWLCTTAVASPAAGEYVQHAQFIEGQFVQDLLWGTVDARSASLSFWVKSNKLGTYIAVFNASQFYSIAYTIYAPDTWERKTITVPGNTVSAIANDSAVGLSVRFWLATGSTYGGGASFNTWGGSYADNKNAVGQVNLGDTVNNYWQITGVQLEVGSTPTPFEHRPYDQELRRCQRYYEEVGFILHAMSSIEGEVNRAANLYHSGYWKVTKRASPTVSIAHVDGGTGATVLPFNGGNGELTGFYQNTQHTADTNSLIVGNCEI